MASPRVNEGRANEPLDLTDASRLAERQLTLDRDRTKRFPALLTRKLERMSASPLAFLRGAAPLFYEILAARKELRDGPPGEGWIVGDLHLENFGAYRPDSTGQVDGAKRRPAVFDLNDFDDTLVGPWHLDVLRLSTSLLLAGRELGASGVMCLGLCDRLIEAWTETAFDDAALPKAPAPVLTLIEQVRTRTQAEMLDARTAVSSGKRRFVRGPRYDDLDDSVLSSLPDVFARYLTSVPDVERPHRPGALEIHDAALRIAGTGSLGGLRMAILVDGKGGKDGQWIFDLKEQDSPSARVIVAEAGGEPREPASRVACGFRACVSHPPRMMGGTSMALGGETLSLFGRRLSPQEDRLNLRKLRDGDLPALAAYLGALVGQAHRRGATSPPRSRWSKSDREAIRAQAIALAGVHEAVYLALCDRIRALGD